MVQQWLKVEDEADEWWILGKGIAGGELAAESKNVINYFWFLKEAHWQGKPQWN